MLSDDIVIDFIIIIMNRPRAFWWCRPPPARLLNVVCGILIAEAQSSQIAIHSQAVLFAEARTLSS